MRFILLFFMALVIAAPVSAETVFLSVMPDIPLMPGAEEVEQISYDKPQGRIAQVSLYMDALDGVETIRLFYVETLPQLGWQALSDGRFSRDGEILVLRVEDGVMRLMIEPFVALQQE